YSIHPFCSLSLAVLCPSSLHDALPIFIGEVVAFCISEDVYRDGRIDMSQIRSPGRIGGPNYVLMRDIMTLPEMSNHEAPVQIPRSEEHTSELQSRENIVCRRLLEKKNK